MTVTVNRDQAAGKAPAARLSRRPKPQLEKSREVRVGRFHTRVIEGAGTGPTALMLHGFSDSADCWRPVMADLVTAGHRTVALDLPNFGRAGRVDPVGNYVPMLDEFVAAAIDAWDDGNGVVLVGNSLGALLVLRAQARDPRVLATVAIGPVGVRPVLWHSVLRGIRPVLRPFLQPSVPTVLHGTVAGPRAITDAFALAVARGRLSEQAKAEYGSHWGPGDLRRQLAMGDRVLDELGANDLIPWAALQAPTTLVWGDHDWIAPAPRHNRLPVGATEYITVRILSGTGHCPQYDRPRAIFEIISSTFDELVTHDSTEDDHS